jgi:hypothetical protein
VKRFYAEAMKRAADGPQPAVVAGVETLGVLATISLIASAISVGLTIIAQFFRPGEVNPARIKSSEQQGRNVSDVRRYAPLDGFDSLQEPASIGQPIPMVFSLKETIDGVTYGGIRVNCSLLWSQLQTSNGQQLLRTVFLVGDGGVSQLDPNGFALGNNLLNAYNIGPGTELGSSYVVYVKPSGGRIESSDRVAGRLANLDPGNAQNSGGADVFSVRSINRAWAGDFCSVIRPGSNAAFGVYSPIGNNLAFRINPIIRSQYQAQLIPKGDDGDAKVVCQVDDVAAAQRDKTRAVFSTRSGFVSGTAAAIGDTLTYVLDKSSDVETNFSKAFNSQAWSVQVEVERIGGSGTNVNEYGSTTSATELVNSILGGQVSSSSNPLINGIQWLDSNDNVTGGPVVSITETSGTKVKLSTKLQYNASALTNEQKRALLYSRFKLTFVNGAVDDDDEPSAYYRVNVQQKTEVSTNYNADFVNSTFSASNNPPATTYTVESTLSSRKTIETNLNKGELYSEPAADIASAIAGKQEQWDDAIQIGGLYKFGTALVVCTGRTPQGEAFYSEAGFDSPSSQSPTPGQSIEATFTVVRPGEIELTTLNDIRRDANEPTERYTATNFPHLFKISIATITTTRPTRLIEIIIRSNLGIRVSNLCNFRDTISYGAADNKACLDYRGDTISKGSTLKQFNYTSGTVTTAQMRYSFFRIRVRESGTTNQWIEFPECYCIRGINQQNQFNTIRLQFPTVAQWEVEMEPLSGWEIRSGNASGTYVLIDDKRTKPANLITRTHELVTLYVYGKQGDGSDVGVVNTDSDPFRLPALHKSQGQGYGNLGYGYTDGQQFVDEFGALAETFVFPEVSSTAESGPEHEIVSVTEIVQNELLPTYAGLATVGLNLLPGNTFRQLGQFSSYVNAGYPEARRLMNDMTLGATHLFPDIALELLTNPIYGTGDQVSDDQIDIDSFKESAEWCYANRYFCDILYLPTNIKEWIAQKAEEHLLYFMEIDGRFVLRPMFPYVTGNPTNWNQPVEIKGIFGLLQMRSFSFSAIEEESRRPIKVSGRWREERKSSSIGNTGIFPVEREILLREAVNSSEEDPTQSFDLSDFVTNEKHLIDYLKMKARVRRLSTHGITMELTQDSLLAPIKPGDYVKVPVEVTFFDEYKTGIVREDGLVVSTVDLEPGTYTAAVWNGVLESEITETDLIIDEDGVGSPTGIIFMIKESTSDYKTYRILDIEPAEASGFTVSAVETPIDENGRLILSQNWGGLTTDGNWVIQK